MTTNVKMASAIGAILLLAFTLSSGGASAASRDADELSRWVPSLALETDLSFHPSSGAVRTGDVYGPYLSRSAAPSPDQPITSGTPAFADPYMVTPSFGVVAEIMTPAWFDLPGRPRLFGHADVIIAFGPTYQMPGIASPGALAAPTDDRISVTEASILGQGAANAAAVQPLQVAAGAGIAFTTQWGGRTVRFKPSFEYLRQEVELSSVVSRAVKYRDIQVPPPCNTDPTCLRQFQVANNFRQISISGKKQATYDGIGPGFQIEVDTGRAGPLILSLYASVKAWAFLNNDPIEIQASNQNAFSAGCQPGDTTPTNPSNPLLCAAEQANFSFQREDWGFGGGFGLRFRWAPEKKR
ncbi:MAG: hypothetical protein P8M78_04125 [Myxococcota bacterium]|nr:hypothetical protein [Myxococcota bacterium]